MIPLGVIASQTTPDMIARCAGAWSARAFDVGNNRLTDLSGNGRHAQNNGALHLWAGAPSVWFPGAVNNPVQLPTADISGDFELVARATRFPGSVAGFMWGKGASSAVGTAFMAVFSTGFRCQVWQGGSSTTLDASTPPSVVAPAEIGWFKVVRDASSGEVSFFEAADQEVEPTVWSPVGSPQAGPAGALDNPTSTLSSGTRHGGGSGGGMGLYEGHVLEAIARDSIGGPPVRHWRARDADPSSSTFETVDGSTATIIRSSAGYKTAVVTEPVMLTDGADDNLGASHNAALNLDPQGSTLVAVWRHWHTPTGSSWLFGKRENLNVSASPNGASLHINTSGNVVARVSDGTTLVSGAGPSTPSLGALHVGALVLDGANSTVVLDGVAGPSFDVSSITGPIGGSNSVRMLAAPNGTPLAAEAPRFAIVPQPLTPQEIGLLAKQLSEV